MILVPLWKELGVNEEHLRTVIDARSILANTDRIHILITTHPGEPDVMKQLRARNMMRIWAFSYVLSSKDSYCSAYCRTISSKLNFCITLM